MIPASDFPAGSPEWLALEFFERVWSPPHDLDAIDDLMTADYAITTAGTTIRGRSAFKAWVHAFQRQLGDARNETLEVFRSARGDRVVSRWICRGTNRGVLGFPADGRAVAFTGIAIWRVENGRLAECWVERSAWELYRALSAPPDGKQPDGELDVPAHLTPLDTADRAPERHDAGE